MFDFVKRLCVKKKTTIFEMLHFKENYHVQMERIRNVVWETETNSRLIFIANSSVLIATTDDFFSKTLDYDNKKLLALTDLFRIKFLKNRVSRTFESTRVLPTRTS